MLTASGNLHLEIQTSRKNPVGILLSSFRDRASKKISHTQHGRITGCSLDQLRMLQAAFREEVVPHDSPKALRILGSKEHGASRALLQLAKDIGLHRILYSRSESWVDCVMAMIVGRIVYQGSKLSLCNQAANTTLWEQCGVAGRPDVEEHCYLPLDRLLERQKAIQKKLAAKHLRNGCMVLYDITSSYFEGEYENSGLVGFGYNRDKKSGHKQVVIGLLCSPEGCPVGCEVFCGNTNDATTVEGKVAELREQYGLEKIVFVGDRGMLTEARLEKLRPVEGLRTVSALTHHQMADLRKREIIQAELFDERDIVEISDPESPGERYCLCRNPVSAQKESDTRRRLIRLTEEGLEKIAGYRQKTTVEILGARVGRHLAKYRMGKFFRWHVDADPDIAASEKKSRNHTLRWSLDGQKVAAEQSLDGCYIVRTDVSEADLSKKEVVDGYKALGNVERAFRNLKTTQLEIRPVYHKSDERIKAHAFLCMLSCYVQWHMVRRVRPLFESDGEGKDRRWTVGNVIEKLQQICRNRVELDGVTFDQITELDAEQKQIIDHLQIAM